MMKPKSNSPPPYSRSSSLEIENYDSSDTERDSTKYETIHLFKDCPYSPKPPKTPICNIDVCSYIFFCFKSQ